MRLAALLAALAALQEAGPATLEWRLGPDTPVRYEFAFDVDMDFGGVPMRQNLLLGLAMDPGPPDEKGAADIRVSIDRVRVEMAGLLETEYDSDADPREPDDSVGRVLSRLRGKTFTMRLTRRGEVLSVTGVEAILKEASKGLEKGGAVRQVRNLLADEQVRRMLQQAIPVLPERPVGKGDSWESGSEWSIPLFGALKMANTSTLEEIREDGAEAGLGLRSKIEVVPGEEEFFEITGAEAKGDFAWLLGRGLLRSSSSHIRLTVGANEQECGVDVRTGLTLAPREAPARKPKPPPGDGE